MRHTPSSPPGHVQAAVGEQARDAGREREATSSDWQRSAIVQLGKVFASRSQLTSVGGRYGLLLILVLLVVMFSALLPQTFPTSFTVRSILATQSPDGLVALAVMVPLATGQFDLSVGYMITLTDVLAVGLQVNQHFPWPLAVLIVLCISAVVGLVNAVCVTKLGIDAFIATLGTGTVMYGLAEWYTGGSQIAGNLPHAFLAITNRLGSVPLPALYLIGAAVIMWIITEYTRAGRLLYFTGASPRAAVLVGIRTQRVLLGAFMASAMLSCLAGLVLASQLAIGNSSIGPEYLLQAYAAAFLGATAIRPGRVNAWGTIIAVFLLAVLVSGLQQSGANFYVESLFDGAILLVAVGLSVFARRRARAAE